MDDSLDSVERIESYATTQRVKRSHQSAKEKEQKFASALKDKMEEERKKKKRRDEVILAEQSEETVAREEADSSESQSESDKETESGGETPPHIDVKA